MSAELEQRGYEVPGRHLGWAKSSLQGAGYPIQSIMPIGGGMYVIVILLPMGAPDVNFQQLPRARRRRVWMPSGKLLVTLAILAVVGVGLYMLANGAITVPGVPSFDVPELPKIELPGIGDPLAGVQKTIDDAVGAAKMFALAVGGIIAAWLMFVMRGPLGALGGALASGAKGLGGMIRKKGGE